MVEEVKSLLVPSSTWGILPDSVNYVTSPARFPMFIKYRNQISLLVAGIIVTLVLSALLSTRAIDSTVFFSLLTITVTIVVALLDITSRRR